jgi:hypothetical protein
VKKWLWIAAIAFATEALGADAAAVGTHKGMWEMAYGDVYYRVVGDVENKSGKPLQYVKMEIDLLDKDGKVVKTLEGYNQEAEFLAGVDATEGIDTGEAAEPFEKKLARVKPIPAGGKDSFRIGIGKNDIPKKPKFTAYKVRIVETK